MFGSAIMSEMMFFSLRGNYKLLSYVFIFCSHTKLNTFKPSVPQKRDIGSKCRRKSDATESVVRSESTLFALNLGIEISVKHHNNEINQTLLLLKMVRSKEVR